MTGFYDAKEFAELLAISSSTFERLLQSGLLPKPIQLAKGGKRRWKKSTVKDFLQEAA